MKEKWASVMLVYTAFISWLTNLIRSNFRGGDSAIPFYSCVFIWLTPRHAYIFMLVYSSESYLLIKKMPCIEDNYRANKSSLAISNLKLATLKLFTHSILLIFGFSSLLLSRLVNSGRLISCVTARLVLVPPPHLLAAYELLLFCSSWLYIAKHRRLE